MTTTAMSNAPSTAMYYQRTVAGNHTLSPTNSSARNSSAVVHQRPTVSGGEVAGIIVGILAFAAIKAVLLVWYLIRRRRQREKDAEKTQAKVDKGNTGESGLRRYEMDGNSIKELHDESVPQLEAGSKAVHEMHVEAAETGGTPIHEMHVETWELEGDGPRPPTELGVKSPVGSQM